MRLRALLLGTIAFAGLAAAPPAAAQSTRAATLKGVVLDAATAKPLQGARIVVSTTGGVFVTDSAGQFEISGLATGIVRFFFSADGFPTASVVLAFASGEVMQQRFELDSTIVAQVDSLRPTIQPLEPTTVTAEYSRGVRYENFERRLKTGRGQYVTRAQIDSSSWSDLGDAVRHMRGVAVECGGGRGCQIRMVRANQGCYPEYIVDDRVDNFFGPYVAIRDIEGLEVYTGAADVPGEYAGRNAGCGVVVIWTKAGPLKKRPPAKP
jgi:hypothetical protein